MPTLPKDQLDQVKAIIRRGREQYEQPYLKVKAERDAAQERWAALCAPPSVPGADQDESAAAELFSKKGARAHLRDMAKDALDRLNEGLFEAKDAREYWLGQSSREFAPILVNIAEQRRAVRLAALQRAYPNEDARLVDHLLEIHPATKREAAFVDRVARSGLTPGDFFRLGDLLLEPGADPFLMPFE